MPSSERVAAVVLAAGLSERFAGDLPKQLLPIHDEPLVRRVVRQAVSSRLSPVVVVTGHRAADIGAALDGLEAEVLLNPRYEEGQSSSVRCGLARVRGECAAAVFIPADLPLLETALLDQLVEAWEETRAPIVLPVYEGVRGAPVLIDGRLFDELARIDGDAGGRQLFPAYEGQIVEVASQTPLLDLDSETDLAGLQ